MILETRIENGGRVNGLRLGKMATVKDADVMTRILNHRKERMIIGDQVAISATQILKGDSIDDPQNPRRTAVRAEGMAC